MWLFRLNKTLQQRSHTWNSHCLHKGAVWFLCRERRPTAYQQPAKSSFHHTPFSLYPSFPPDTSISAATLFFLFFHSHPVVSLQMEHSLPLSNACKCYSSRLADAIASDDQRSCVFCQTYLSVLLQICFISYKDHGKFISVFYS